MPQFPLRARSLGHGVTPCPAYSCTVCLPMGAWSRKSLEMGLIHITTTMTGARKLVWSRTLWQNQQRPHQRRPYPTPHHKARGSGPPPQTSFPPLPAPGFTQLGQGLVGRHPQSVEVGLGQAQPREGQAGAQEGAEGHQPQLEGQLGEGHPAQRTRGQEGDRGWPHSHGAPGDPVVLPLPWVAERGSPISQIPFPKPHFPS